MEQSDPNDETTLGPAYTPEEQKRRVKCAYDLYLLTEVDRRPRWYTQRLFELMLHADGHNLAKLATAYPIEAGVLMRWREHGPGWLAHLAGVPQEARKP